MKFKTISRGDLVTHIYCETECICIPEDTNYSLPPESFFGKSWSEKTFGLKGLKYVADKFDCDNFADVLRTEFKTRFWRMYANNSKVPYDIFCELVKVQITQTGGIHMIVCAVCDDGQGNPKLIFRERTGSTLGPVTYDFKILGIKGV